MIRVEVRDLHRLPVAAGGEAEGLQPLPAALSDIPLLLVLPEHDFEWIVAASAELLERCATKHRTVDVIEGPGGHDGFETVDDSDEVRDTVSPALDHLVGQAFG